MSTPQTLEGLQSGLYKGISKLKISSGISQFPSEILSLSSTLEILDLSGNTSLSELPPSISQLTNLKIAFFSSCSFTTFPSVLASCPALEMVAFKGNGIRSIPENSFPARLRWLILTDNAITQLPKSIGRCGRLQKCMLAGNQLAALPDEMSACKKLGLLRLSCNLFPSLPAWLFEMPELGFLSFSGNPCSTPRTSGNNTPSATGELEHISWSDLSVQELLGEGASGIISKATWSKTDNEEVAVKIFKGAVTSDGSPADEMDICIAAGTHTNLISPLGRISAHPDGKHGLVLELVPKHYGNLGGPPNFETCTRDVFHPDTQMSVLTALRILLGIASAAEHLHAKGIKHGDLYAHNILWDGETGHALLGDFGAGTSYEEEKVEGLEVFAFGLLVEDLVGLVLAEMEKEKDVVGELERLGEKCMGAVVGERPRFGIVRRVLERLVEAM